jgi:hypothetical protein
MLDYEIKVLDFAVGRCAVNTVDKVCGLKFSAPA